MSNKTLNNLHTGRKPKSRMEHAISCGRMRCDTHSTVKCPCRLLSIVDCNENSCSQLKCGASPTKMCIGVFLCEYLKLNSSVIHNDVAARRA